MNFLWVADEARGDMKNMNCKSFTPSVEIWVKKLLRSLQLSLRKVSSSLRSYQSKKYKNNYNIFISNDISFQGVGDHGYPLVSFLYFFCKLLWLLRKYSGVVSSEVRHDFAFNVILLLEWVPTKTKKSLVCSII